MKNPDPLDPLLRAVLEDEIWQEAGEITRRRAGSILRRRRIWRTARGPLAAAALVIIIATACWNFDRPTLPPVSVASNNAMTPAEPSPEVHLQIDSPLPAPADSFALCMYKPEPSWAGLTPLSANPPEFP